MDVASPLALGPALALIAAAALLGRMRGLSRSRDALVVPLHELRGAVTALELGLSFAERRLRSAAAANGAGIGLADGAVGASLAALRGPLMRAALAIEELDSSAEREAASRRTKLDRWLDLTALLMEKVRLWARLAPAYHARLELAWAAGRVELRGDAGALARALDNLLSNALEHGGRDVLVEAQLRATTLRIVISDGGPGLPAVVDGPVRRFSRRGHGLRIAREIIERHNGRLGAGVGARGPGVVVEFPVRPSDSMVRALPKGVPGRVAVPGMDLEPSSAA
jgi:signal transduction histidine kinase